MTLWINLFEDGSALLESVPAGDSPVPLHDLLPERAVQTLARLSERRSSRAAGRATAVPVRSRRRSRAGPVLLHGVP